MNNAVVDLFCNQGIVKKSLPPVPYIFQFLWEPHRYKSVYGGRGSGKSWAVADTLLIMGVNKKHRILCTRELQSTIADSVHKLLSDEISRLGLQEKYEIQKNIIIGTNGTEFIFKGLRFNIYEIKSTEGIDICWIEEAQSVSEESWTILIPTIRKEGSEIWLSWNTGEMSDSTYQRFVVNPPPGCVSKLVNWRDNPYFPETLNKERLYCKDVDPDAYANIWEGEPRFISDALVFKGKFTICEFDAPKDPWLMYGADWGFSQHPTALVRCYIDENNLYIDYEACGIGVEFDQIPELFEKVAGVRNHKIIADSSRPDTISYIKRLGFFIVPCNKSSKTNQGFIMDGIEYMRNFRNIFIHPRCKNVINEFQHYSYKKDKDGNILPTLEDSYNHTIDALRCALQDRIRGVTDWVRFVG